jgi:hypothetical protein
MRIDFHNLMMRVWFLEFLVVLPFLSKIVAADGRVQELFRRVPCPFLLIMDPLLAPRLRNGRATGGFPAASDCGAIFPELDFACAFPVRHAARKTLRYRLPYLARA